VRIDAGGVGYVLDRWRRGPGLIAGAHRHAVVRARPQRSEIADDHRGRADERERRDRRNPPVRERARIATRIEGGRAQLRADRPGLDLARPVRHLVVAESDGHQDRVTWRVGQRLARDVLRVAVRLAVVPQVLLEREQHCPRERVRVGGAEELRELGVRRRGCPVAMTVVPGAVMQTPAVTMSVSMAVSVPVPVGPCGG
jgi:hypothetical protein